MKYVIVSFLRRCIAAVTAFFTVLFGGGPAAAPKERPADNAVTAYDLSAADCAFTVDAANQPHGISDLLFGV